MSEKTCPHCMALGQRLEAAQLEVRRLEAGIEALEQQIGRLDRDHRAELAMAREDGYLEAQQESDGL